MGAYSVDILAVGFFACSNGRCNAVTPVLRLAGDRVSPGPALIFTLASGAGNCPDEARRPAAFNRIKAPAADGLPVRLIDDWNCAC